MKVSNKHQMLYLELADGRQLKVTPEHPSAFPYISIDQLTIGDMMDGSTITKKYRLCYSAGYTFDILPKGTTGNYWANDILIGSTLSASNYFLTNK